MKKLMKPFAVLFLVAISTGAYAQQQNKVKLLKEKPARQAHHAVASDHKKQQQGQPTRKAKVVPKNDARVKRVMRAKGLSM